MPIQRVRRLTQTYSQEWGDPEDVKSFCQVLGFESPGEAKGGGWSNCFEYNANKQKRPQSNDRRTACFQRFGPGPHFFQNPGRTAYLSGCSTLGVTTGAPFSPSTHMPLVIFWAREEMLLSTPQYWSSTGLQGLSLPFFMRKPNLLLEATSKQLKRLFEVIYYNK